MSDKLIDIDHLIESKNPKLKKWLPKFVIRYIKRIIHQDEINAFILKNKHLKNEEFCLAVIDQFGITISVKGLENLPETGGLIAVSNHPLGGIDAMGLVSVLQEKRKDIRFIVNDLLLHLESLQEMLQGVNKHGRNTQDSLKQVDDLFATENLVLLFPAGLVSRKIKGKVKDLEWKKTFISRAVKYQKNVVPIHVDGRLSNFFYHLAKVRTFFGIKANVEMFYLVDEMFKQKNRTINIAIGKPISYTFFDNTMSYAQWAEWVKEQVYSLSEK
ncbi:MAG: 1-acyl-sn-glycerol-3-phosphate acyltransferase [Bacteroidia bacterium]